jgi:hypothetical protein
MVCLQLFQVYRAPVRYGTPVAYNRFFFVRLSIGPSVSPKEKRPPDATPAAFRLTGQQGRTWEVRFYTSVLMWDRVTYPDKHHPRLGKIGERWENGSLWSGNNPKTGPGPPSLLASFGEEIVTARRRYSGDAELKLAAVVHADAEAGG